MLGDARLLCFQVGFDAVHKAGLTYSPGTKDADILVSMVIGIPILPVFPAIFLLIARRGIFGLIVTQFFNQQSYNFRYLGQFIFEERVAGFKCFARLDSSKIKVILLLSPF
ncbi:MAG: hypothetical protein HQK59_14350 [Deltaproteobacteria bacterium]|nr:hypothetical protein [Deltaproteobacteria bacterium]